MVLTSDRGQVTIVAFNLDHKETPYGHPSIVMTSDGRQVTIVAFLARFVQGLRWVLNAYPKICGSSLISFLTVWTIHL